ncbi:hypothetical protein B0H63DRAFT_483528 [Podospora didyma]|uniref:Secreted protein n=1 Tax=Podospora didyma TaxID=330526 RepID=A0AAE0N772_9PEZI|nr:hypothetical protein B0H63DRAFT_483528 [Podospora didyma]
MAAVWALCLPSAATQAGDGSDKEGGWEMWLTPANPIWGRGAAGLREPQTTGEKYGRLNSQFHPSKKNCCKRSSLSRRRPRRQPLTDNSNVFSWKTLLPGRPAPNNTRKQPCADAIGLGVIRPPAAT